MKIDPPSGSGPRIPELPDGENVGSVHGARGPGSAGRLGQSESAGNAEEVARIESLETSELRALPGDLDAGDPDRLETATNRMVDWVLTDTFGQGVLDGPKGAELRAAVRDQLLGDPGQASRIQRILDRLQSA